MQNGRPNSALYSLKLVQTLLNVILSQKTQYAGLPKAPIKAIHFYTRSVKKTLFPSICRDFHYFQNIAQIYWNEKNYAQARYHYLHSRDGNGCAKLLIELQVAQGFGCEADLFIAQAVLQFLCLSNKSTASQTFSSYTKEHPNIKKSGPPYLLPLLNFVWFLLQAIER